MNIYLMRHFEVDFNWDKKYTSEEFKLACKKYDQSGIIHQNIEFDTSNIQIYTSELIRSHLTYKSLKTNRSTYKTSLINEVPITPFINTKYKIPTSLWMVIGRLQWYLNIKTQPEVKNDTLYKITLLINQLEKANKNTLIIGHGFYFSQLKKILKRKNYSGNSKNYYKNGEIIKFSKI